MRIVKYILISSIIFLFAGCSNVKPDVVNTIYIKKSYPKPEPKPKFRKYEVLILEINGKKFYALQKSEALILITDWIAYKHWAELNYQHLLMLQKSNSK